MASGGTHSRAGGDEFTGLTAALCCLGTEAMQGSPRSKEVGAFPQDSAAKDLHLAYHLQLEGLPAKRGGEYTHAGD